jgi:chitodextrinase
MVRRIISIGFAALMILNVLVVMNVIPVPSARGEQNPPQDTGLGYYDTYGDWIIDPFETKNYQDITIVVSGDLIVSYAANLTLEGVTLKMNSSYNGEYNIIVESHATFEGGDLIIKESGVGPSIITSNTEDGGHRFGFIVESGATAGRSGWLSMTNSELRECGWDAGLGNNSDDSGLKIESTGNVINGNKISNVYNGVNYIGTTADNNVFQNNNVSLAENGTYVRFARDITIDNNDFYECREGVNVNGTTANIVVTNNHFNRINRFSAFIAQAAGVTFDYNIVENQLGILNFIWPSVVFSESSTISANYNTLHNLRFHGMYAAQFTGGVTYTYNKFDDYDSSATSSPGVAFGASIGDTVYYYRNTMGENSTKWVGEDTVGIWASRITGNCSIIENEVYNATQSTWSNTGAGIQLWGVDDVLVQGNILKDNLASGAYVLDSGNVSLTFENNILERNGNDGIRLTEPGTPPSFGGVHNARINNNIINDSYFGIVSSEGTNHVITNNRLDGIRDTAIWTGIDDTYIAFNNITNHGDGVDTGGQGGIGIVGNTNGDPTVDNVVVYQNDIINGRGSPNRVTGMYLRDVDNIHIEENQLLINNIGIATYANVTNTLVENCTITDVGGTDLSFQLVTDSHVTTLNTTLNNASLSVDSTSSLTVKWYLDVNVKQGGSGKNGASVYIQSILGADDPPTGQPFITGNMDGEDGWVKWIPLTEFVYSSDTREDHTEHFVNITSGSTQGLSRPNLWQSQKIYVDLNEVPTTIDLKLGETEVYRNNSILLFINGTDVEDGEGWFTVEVEYRDPNDFYWNRTFIVNPLYYDPDSDPDDDDGIWYVTFAPNETAVIGLYDIRARVVDTYGSASPWEVLDQAVNVLNNRPFVERMWNATTSSELVAPDGAVYRGDYSWIYGDGHDEENGDDQYLTAEFQWSNNAGGSWEGFAFWDLGPEVFQEDWRRQFSPPNSIDTPTGTYLFQVRYQDSDSEWGDWENLEALEVLNYPPHMNSFLRQNTVVYREDPVGVRIYASVGDREDDEQYPDFIGQVKFFYNHTSSGTQFDDAWMANNGEWDNVLQMYYADFTPPGSADLGSYKFMVEITDHEAPSVDGNVVQAFPLDNIEVKNNNPVLVDIKVSSDTVRANVNEKVFIHVNATDGGETPEEFLKIKSIKWRRNQDTGAPFDNPTNEFSINLDEGYHSGGGNWIIGSLSPKDTSKVWYDIQIIVEDEDDGESNVMELNRAFQVVNPAPIIDDVTLGVSEAFRGDTVYIFLNATDLSQSENQLLVEIQYRMKDTLDPWITITGSSSSDFHSGAEEYWHIPFTPGTAAPWDDDALGLYEFQARVKNNAAYSNDGEFIMVDGTIDVMNKKPEAMDLGIVGNDDTVERGSSITIFAEGYDRETAENLLAPTIEYSLDGSAWSTLTNAIFRNQRWEVEFTPDGDTLVGEYHFKVTFGDGKSLSNVVQKDKLVNVINSVPVVSSLMLSTTSAYRGEKVTLTATVTDADQDEGTLIPNFQYKIGNGNWVSQTETTYFKDAFEATDGQWVITFEAPEGAEIGDYSFQVEFSDEAQETSEVVQSTQKLELLNHDPEVEIQTPLPGATDSLTHDFTADATDEDGSSFNWDWDFGDGDGSQEPTPSHDYSGPGTYIITVTVTDDDDGEATDTITIIVTGESGGFDMMTLLMLLIPIIIGVLLLVFLMARKKKKPEEIPPAVPPAMAPQATGAPPPMAGPPIAETPPPAAPVAQPPPPPVPMASAPVAAPAAAPAPPAGGQKIKCPKCGTPFTVTETQRPITIECPNCHAKGKLN